MGDKLGKISLSSRYVNALITDASDTIHLVYIKQKIGSHFLADVDGQVYCFKIGQIKTFKETLTKTYKMIFYDVRNYMPISPDNEKLKLCIAKNKLPPIDKSLFIALQELAKREKKPITQDNPHKLLDAFNALSSDKKAQNKKYQDAIQEIKDYLLSLNIEEIVTPLSRITDHIYNDLIATGPDFIGAAFNQLSTTQNAINSVMNKPEKGKKSFIVLLLVIGLVITIAAMIYFMNEAGAFEGIGSGLSQFSGAGGYDQDSLMKRYPSGEALANAVDSGQLDYNKLPKAVQDMVDLERAPKG